MACNVYVFEQFPDLRTGIRHAYPGGAKREGPSGLTPTYAQKRNNMLPQVKPPFRADHIGSLLRPTALLQPHAKSPPAHIHPPPPATPPHHALKHPPPPH